jgi:hypothetical protein
VYDVQVEAKNAGRILPGITRLSDTGLEGSDYSKALRMLEAGLSFSYRAGDLRIALRAK